MTATIATTVITLSATANGTNGDRTVTVRVSEPTATANAETGSVDSFLIYHHGDEQVKLIRSTIRSEAAVRDTFPDGPFLGSPSMGFH